MIASVQMNHPQGSKIVQLWINDVDVIANGNMYPMWDYSPAFKMKFIGEPFRFGHNAFGPPPPADGGAANANLNADIAEAWFGLGQFLDLSVIANRRKFRDVSGNPVSLGADGSLPTGTPPAVYFSGNASSFATNRGNGGAFVLTGTLTNASTSPAGVSAVHFANGIFLFNAALTSPGLSVATSGFRVGVSV